MPKSENILPLIQMLCLLAKHKGFQIDPYVLQANAYNTDAIFSVLARMGFPTRTIAMPLDGVLDNSLPCLLVLTPPAENMPNRACLLLHKQKHSKKNNENNSQDKLEIIEDKAEKYTVILSDNAPTHSSFTKEELAQIYTGFAVFPALNDFSSFEDESSYSSEIISEDKNEESSNWFWNIFARYLPLYKNVFLASIVINCFVLASPLFVMNVYDRVIPNNAIDTLWVLAIGVCIAYLADFLLKILRSYFVDLAGKNTDALASSKIMEKLLKTKISSMPRSTGLLVNSVREFEQIRDFIGSTTLVALLDIPFVLLFIIIIGFLAGPLVIIPLVLLPIMIAVAHLFQIPLKKTMDAQFKLNESKNAVLIDAMLGLETVKTNLLQSVVQDNFDKACIKSADAHSQSKRMNMLAVSSSQLVGALANTAVIIMGAYLISAGSMSMGALIAVVILMGRVIGSLTQLANVIMVWQKTLISKKKLDAIMLLEEENSASSSLILPAEEASLGASLKVENLSFTYPKAEAVVLDNLSFEISAGEKVALIGHSGSGKSTLLKLIMALYEPSQGRILLDSLETRHLHTALLRSKIGYLSQEPFLFTGSIVENISMGALGVSQYQIMKAAEIAGVLDFTKHFSKGLMTFVGERGSNLSGGQKQAIALARTLIRDPQILLLDEPTASLDSESERNFVERAKHAFAHKTIILSSHKPMLLSLANRAIVLEQGKLITSTAKIEKNQPQAGQNSQLKQWGEANKNIGSTLHLP